MMARMVGRMCARCGCSFQTSSDSRVFRCRECHTPPTEVQRVTARRGAELTVREWQCAALVAEGKKNKEVAQTIGLTEGTVKVYLNRAYVKTGVESRLELALWFFRTEGKHAA